MDGLRDGGEGEDVAGGGEEFGLGDVADGLDGAEVGREDEGEDAGAGFFVAGGEGDEACCGNAEGGERAVAEDELLDAGGGCGGEGVAGDGEAGGGDHAPADGLAVEEFAVAGGGFDGVAEGVAEVEDHAEAGLALVGGDDVCLDADAGGDDVGNGFWVGGVGGVEDGVCVALEKAEEFGRADDGSFDGFHEAGAELAGGQGAEEGGVGEDGERLVKAADEVFAGGEIDAGLAANRGVDLSEEGGGDLDEGDARM